MLQRDRLATGLWAQELVAPLPASILQGGENGAISHYNRCKYVLPAHVRISYKARGHDHSVRVPAKVGSKMALSDTSKNQRTQENGGEAWKLWDLLDLLVSTH